MVVPAYNEEHHVAKVVAAMPELVDHIFVVDDHSTDRTFEIATAAAEHDDRTEVLQHKVNKGVGGSIVTGHRRAIEVGADVVVVMAGDGQMDPQYLPDLIGPVVTDGYGFAKANRFDSAMSFNGMPRHRVVGNVALTFLTKIASGYWNLVDPQNGYTAIRREVLERLPLGRLAERYEFENDQLDLAQHPQCPGCRRVHSGPVRQLRSRRSGCTPSCPACCGSSLSGSGGGSGASTCCGPSRRWL